MPSPSRATPASAGPLAALGATPSALGAITQSVAAAIGATAV